MRPSHLADRVVPVRAKVSSVSPPPFPDRVRPQAPVGRMRPSALADRVVPVRAKVSSVSPPPFPDRVRPQAPVGSVLLPLLDCIDSLQTPVGSMGPIASVWLGDRRCYRRSNVVRQ